MRTRNGISKASVVLGSLLWGAVAGSLFVVSDKPQTAENAETRSDVSGSSADDPIRPDENKASVKLGFPARTLPDFEFNDCRGGTVSLESLRGRRWVASFVFSRCTTSCPMISAAVMKVHDRVKKNAADVQFVSITVDPKYDTPEVFHEYSKTFTRGDFSRWSFLTGSQQQIYELVVKGFGLIVKENLGESRMPGFEVAHTNRVVLVNEDGIPVGTFLGTRDEDMVKLSRILTGREEFPAPGPALSFSTSDGSPLNVQFELQPVDGDSGPAGEADASDETLPPETADQPSQPIDGRQPASDQTAAQHNAAIDLKLPTWARRLPTINASLNSLAAVLLLLGFWAIRINRKTAHRNLMISAFLTSAVFLGCYLVYHWALGEYTGQHGKKFAGTGIAAIVYPWILWPHIVLAVFVPVLALRVFQHAFAERWDAHKKLAKVTFPIWMFVSVTGVVIYGMLYHWPI